MLQSLRQLRCLSYVIDVSIKGCTFYSILWSVWIWRTAQIRENNVGKVYMVERNINKKALLICFYLLCYSYIDCILPEILKMAYKVHVDRKIWITNFLKLIIFYWHARLQLTVCLNIQYMLQKQKPHTKLSMYPINIHKGELKTAFI